MKYSSILLLLITVCSQSFSQGGEFKPAFIVSNTGDTLSVEIKYDSWVTTPESIVFRLTEEAATRELFPGDIKSFSILGISTYISATTKIDESSNLDNQLSLSLGPQWETKTIFLKELLVSSVSLYRYSTTRFIRFFYKKRASQDYQQLIYKRFNFVGGGGASNLTFKNQLIDNFKCGLDAYTLKKVDYFEKDFIKFFTKYNLCIGSTVEKSISKSAKGSFRINLKAGFYSINGSFTRKETIFNIIAETESKFKPSGFRADAEIEYLTPFDNKRLAIILNIGLEQFQATGILPQQILQNIRMTAVNRFDQPWSIDYTNLAFGVGIRRYISLSNSTELFFDFLLQPVVNLTAKYEYEFAEIEDFQVYGTRLEKVHQINMGISLGVKVKSFSLTGRYFSKREFLYSQIGSHSVNFSSTAFQLGYIFN